MEGAGRKDLQMCTISKSFPANIEFESLSYRITAEGGKYILKAISGKFLSGNLTAILGSSGSGKTTLLNVLTGCVSKGVSGTVRINGSVRDMKLFHKISAYIMQNDLLQPFLRVEELMMLAAKLKLGNHISLSEKCEVVNQILQWFDLSKCSDTLTEHLSGGEMKRLSIALEMVSNPPILFLDEPTSGLDTVSANQCLKLLKMLSQQGRTIITTIHQPSAYALQNVDQVYFVEDGMCVYNGSMSEIVPFMSSLGYSCPATYNPADFLIETVQTIEGSAELFMKAIENGKTTTSRQLSSIPLEDKEPNARITNFATPFWTQFTILLSRMMLQIRRNTTPLWILLSHHLILAVMMGVAFYNVGNNASYIRSDFLFCFATLVIFVYTYGMVPVLLFPMEIELIRREYFNRWYSIRAYFLALTIRNIPAMIVFASIYVIPTYLLSDQPLELNRFALFFTICILTAMSAEAVGLAIGSVFNIKTGSIVCTIVLSGTVLFGLYGLGYTYTLPKFLLLLLKLGYLRVSLIAISLTVFESRGLLDCSDEEFCYMKDPRKLLHVFGMRGESCSLHILGLLAFVVVLRFFAFFMLNFRLNSELYRRFKSYVSKYVRF